MTQRYRRTFRSMWSAGGIVLVVISMAGSLSRAAEPDAASVSLPESTVVAAQRRASNDKFHRPRLSLGEWLLLPVVSYSSEASFGTGAEAVHSFRWPESSPDARSSTVHLSGKATLNGQAEIGAVTNLSWGRGTYALRARASYSTLPRRFYGIGPDTPLSDKEVYEPQRLFGYIEIFRRVIPHLRLGLRYEFEEVKLLETESGARLESGEVFGTRGKSVAGAGVLLDWDSRDRKGSPRAGAHYQAFALFFDDEIGSEHDFNVYHADLRNYFSLTDGHVLATQAFIFATEGDPPFWRLAALGGRAHTRGYRKGRFLDDLLVSAQAEYRSPTRHRFGMVAFAGLAQVAPRLSKLQIKHVRASVGGGLRFRLGSGSGRRARLDVGFGGDTPRFYLGIGEAF